MEIPDVFGVNSYDEVELKLSVDTLELVYEFDEKIDSICSAAYEICEEIRKYTKNDWEKHSYDYFVYSGNCVEIIGKSYDGSKESFYLSSNELCDPEFVEKKKSEFRNLVKQREEAALNKHLQAEKTKLDDELKEFKRLKEKFE